MNATKSSGMRRMHRAIIDLDEYNRLVDHLATYQGVPEAVIRGFRDLPVHPIPSQDDASMKDPDVGA